MGSLGLQFVVVQHALHHVDDGAVEALGDTVVFWGVWCYLVVDDPLVE